MVKFLWNLLQISLILLLVAYVGHFNAPVQIQWRNYLVEASLLTLTVATSSIFFLLLVLCWLWGKLRNAPNYVYEFQKQRRRDAGYRALTRGMVALAAGEKFAAQKAAQKAESLLKDPPLTMLLSAQSAQLNGDEMAAKTYFRMMLDHSELAFLGWRGLIMQALRAGNTSEAQKLLTEAEARFPKQPWLLEQALDFEEKRGNATKALTLVSRAQRAGALTRLEAKERKVLILLQQAQVFYDQQRFLEAINPAQEAWKMIKKQNTKSDLAQDETAFDSQVLLSKIYLQTGNTRQAETALRLRWQWRCDEEVFVLLNDLYAKEGTTLLQKWRKFRHFFQDLTLSSSGAVRLAQMAIAAGLMGEAEAMLDKDPNPEHPDHFDLRIQLAQERQDKEMSEYWIQKAKAHSSL